jgi:hypothetical protein
MNLQHMVAVDSQWALGIDVELDTFSSTQLSSHLRFQYFSFRLRNQDLMYDCSEAGGRYRCSGKQLVGGCRKSFGGV